MDYQQFLDKTLRKYNRWQDVNKIKNTSKVIPIQKSLDAEQWIMPLEQVLLHLRNSRSFALTDCQCRSLAKKCDHPVDVCFLINDAADMAVKHGKAKYVSLEEAEATLMRAEEAGLVHMTLFNPEQHFFALCNCCECCCHDLTFLKKYGRRELVARSDYVAVTDMEACTSCGICVDRCPFDARSVEDGSLVYDQEACYGCGLCVPVCPVEATVMVRREGLGAVLGSEAGRGCDPGGTYSKP